MITKKIANVIKNSLNNVDEKAMYYKMKKHYKLLHLIDDKGKWSTPELQKISNYLLPKNIDNRKSKAFVDEMADIASKNPYLMNFLEKAEKTSFPKLKDKVQKEGLEVFPDVVALSFVIEKLTKAMYNEPKILRSCVDTFDKVRANSDAGKDLGLFHKVKHWSIEKPIKEVILKAGETGNISPKAFTFMLPLNIAEATLADHIMGYNHNALTGVALTSRRPDGKREDKRTQAGPSKWSKDKKGVEISVPMPKKWTDLYQTWNMAFASQINDFPYIMPKLLIPQVAKYQEKPKEYIHNRAMALYVYLNFQEFYCMDKIKKNEPFIQWDDKKLTKLWGKSNFESTIDYEKTLMNLKRNVKEKLKNKNSDRKKEAETLRKKLNSKNNKEEHTLIR